jgi:hypothetical protein
MSVDLLPRHELIGDGTQEYSDGDEIAEAVPHHRVPVQVEHLLGRQGADCDDLVSLL